MEKILEKFRFGFDFWAVVLYALLILPYIVYWCLPEVSGVDNGAMTVASHLFGFFAAAILTVTVRREREKKPLFDTAFTSLSLLLLLYYAAWIVLFCGKQNFAVLFFVIISPCLALILMSTDRKNPFAILPLAVFTVLQTVSAIQIGLAL